ncbi:MAG: hypothetical protein E6R07_12920 [Nevskiaceae bacterium]|nr:MAG: hypothetical protein E6R07_12920 [Nevskiaceae bacterium]
MSARPIVSVLFLARDPAVVPLAASSVLRQQYREVELLIGAMPGADAGLDALLRDLAMQDARVRQVDAVSWRDLLAAAQGDFVALQFERTEWLTGRLRAQCALIETLGSSCAAVVGWSVRHVANTGSTMLRWPTLGEDAWVDVGALERGLPLLAMTGLFRRQALADAGLPGGNDPTPALTDWAHRFCERHRVASVSQFLTVVTEPRPAGAPAPVGTLARWATRLRKALR